MQENIAYYIRPIIEQLERLERVTKLVAILVAGIGTLVLIFLLRIEFGERL